MAFASAEDLTGNAELIIFPTTYAQIAPLLDEHQVFIIKGVVDITSTTTCKIKVNALIPAQDLFTDPTIIKSVCVRFDDAIAEEALETVKSTLPAGNYPLHCAFKENGFELLLMSNTNVDCSLEALKQLAQHGITARVGI